MLVEPAVKNFISGPRRNLSTLITDIYVPVKFDNFDTPLSKLSFLDERDSSCTVRT